MQEPIKEYTPQELATKRRQLAQEYNLKMKEISAIKKRKAFDIIELMAEHKTVSKAELYYNTTEDGQKLIELEYFSKGLLELMRSIKSEIDIKANEAYNMY